MGFSSGAPRIRQRGSGGRAPSGPPSGLNPPLLALLVDLRYSVSIFVCRLVFTENISGGQLPLLPPPLATPLSVSYML